MINMMSLTKCGPVELYEVVFNWMSDMSRTNNFTKGGLR